jgi:hypothetical protein
MESSAAASVAGECIDQTSMPTTSALIAGQRTTSISLQSIGATEQMNLIEETQHRMNCCKMRDRYDCTPQQYHGGLDKLWAAIGVNGVQDEDVFTMSARAIMQGQVWKRSAQHGSLRKALLYPCHCGRFTVDEWYGTKEDGYHKEKSVFEVANIDEARAIYRAVVTLRESHYMPAKDSYTSRDELDNFIVTGSHCRCKEHIGE